jgi:DNA-nicking Smr family endonuclease
MKKRSENSNDKELWQRLADTVNPLPQDRLPEKPNAPLTKTTSDHHRSDAIKRGLPLSSSSPFPISNALRKSDLQPADLQEHRVSGISRADAKRITSGQIAPTATLDLHGMTAASAHVALKRFIDEKYHQGHHHVLIITGKGDKGKGIIRSSLPDWLNEPPLSHQVVAFHPAKPKDGGAGAWYIKLRRLGRSS